MTESLQYVKVADRKDIPLWKTFNTNDADRIRMLANGDAVLVLQWGVGRYVHVMAADGAVGYLAAFAVIRGTP